MSDLVEGYCDPRFAKVRDAFAANFAAGREVGASFAATLDGELVIDLWGGFADAARSRAWQRDTIVNLWSTTKAMTALVAHVLADRGILDLERLGNSNCDLTGGPERLGNSNCDLTGGPERSWGAVDRDRRSGEARWEEIGSSHRL